MIEWIKPGEFDLKELDKIIRDSLEELVDLAADNYEQSYHNWDDRPDFRTEQQMGQDWAVEYKTDSVPYVWVDDGTPSHEITPKNSSGFLSFKTGGTPMTTKNTLRSGSGAFGNTWRRARKVQNPGIEARDFTGKVHEKVEERIELVFEKNQLKAKGL